MIFIASLSNSVYLRPQDFRQVDAKLKKGEQWAEGEEIIERLFELVQLDIWASLASALALSSDALSPAMSHSELAEYVKEEQDTYASFVKQGIQLLLREDRELQQGGRDAVAAVCNEIEQQLRDSIVSFLADTGVETTRLEGCRQVSDSLLQLYQDAVAAKAIFDAVSKPRRFFI